MQVKSIAGGIVFTLLLQAFASGQQPVRPQATSSQSQTGESAQRDGTETAEPRPANQSSGGQIPDSPGSVLARNKLQATIPNSAPADVDPPSDTELMRAQQSDTATAPPAQGAKASPQSNNQLPDGPSQGSTPPSAQSQQQQTPHEPVGTAAAESVEVTGVAASRPAGAAVAPAKQRRARSILIKVGALVGAGVAIGTTMALSQGSPSKPPGSH
jgi:hypothetical protein